jgi:polyribonucleotide nucleotidyltransferase
MPKHEVSIDFDGKKYSLETGRFAKFASGSVMARCGDTMVLVTSVAAEKEDLDKDFLPLSVEYREKLASSGKIPGGFLKRETKPSDHEVLIARLIDRPCRPLIPKKWRFETQVIATVYSFDPEVCPDTVAAVAASASLLLSDIPFAGPFSEVTVGKIDGQLVVNPSFEQLKNSTLDLTISGTDTAITMVEGECKEISEEEFIEVLQFAHDRIKQLNGLQRELAALAAKPKREFTNDEAPEEFVELVKSEIYDELKTYVHSITSKKERQATRKELLDRALEKLNEKFGEDEQYAGKIDKYAGEVLGKLEKKEMRSMILDNKIRLDGRGHEDIRPISCEIGVLPRVHGSALFTRGETQALCTATLGTKSDEQMVDGLQPTYTNSFFLHYNFPPFSTGEVKRLGMSRREVGHGNLAERALKGMMPDNKEFPYVIRIISDVLESNGSSSMATVCGGTLALLDAGVPMKKPVAGIAMGLIKEEEKVAVLSDILGDEDFLGDMDFKVTGTADGITACQMDIKIEGLSIEIMTQALEQARRGRMHILGIMNQTIDAPKADLSAYAPRYYTIKIPTDTIGAVIGPGGEMIRSIVKDTNTDINIEDDGSVVIAATDSASGEAAIAIIKQITSKPEEGTIYKDAKVKEIIDGIGAVVEFMPKKQGLIHISQLATERIENVQDVLNEGDLVDVMLIEASRDGKYRLSRRAVSDPDNFTMPAPRGDSRGGGRGGDRRGGGNDRGPRRDSRR